MKKLQELTTDDYIAFLYSYRNKDQKNIEVAKISFINKDYFVVHFLYGHHSVSEIVKFEDVVAIGDNVNGKIEFSGWKGKFILLKNIDEFKKYIKI